MKGTQMVKRIPRLLLAFSSLLAAAGAAIHAAPFDRALAAISAANLRPFYGNSFKALWLGDSTTLFIFAAISALIAARPSAATRPVVLLLALNSGGCRSSYLHISRGLFRRSRAFGDCGFRIYRRNPVSGSRFKNASGLEWWYFGHRSSGEFRRRGRREMNVSRVRGVRF